mgnify:CR=1 FL=1
MDGPLCRTLSYSVVLCRTLYAFFLAIWLLCRAAAFLCTSPLRAARSTSWTAVRFSASVDAGVRAFLRAVRSVARCARLRTVAARVLRMFFLADAILGTLGTLFLGSNVRHAALA